MYGCPMPNQESPPLKFERMAMTMAIFDDMSPRRLSRFGIGGGKLLSRCEVCKGLQPRYSATLPFEQSAGQRSRMIVYALVIG